MSVTNKVFIPSKTMEAAQTTQYTAPTTSRAVIDMFTATNTSGSTATISVNLVTVSDTASASNLIVDAVNIGVGETYNFPELVGHYLEAGGFISTLGTASALTIRASGREIS
jgi:hypothetical protein